MAFGFIVAPEKLRSTATLAKVPMCDAYAQLAQKYDFTKAEENAPMEDVSDGTLGYTAIAFVLVGLCLIGGTAGLMFWKQQVQIRRKQELSSESAGNSEQNRIDEDVRLPRFD
jgi:hypothetical protein